MSDVCSEVCCAAALGALVCVLAAGELLLGESLRLPREHPTYSDSGAVAGPLGEWTPESLNADPVGPGWSSQEADWLWPESETQPTHPIETTPLLFYIADAGIECTFYKVCTRKRPSVRSGDPHQHHSGVHLYMCLLLQER